MKHAYSLALVLALPLLQLLNPAQGAAQALAKSMGNLRWGMSESEVKRVVKTKIADLYAKQLKSAKSAQKAGLEREMKSKQSAVESGFVQFTGKSSRWDRSPVAGEFTYGHDEAMLAANDGDSDNYYFFIGDRLWKWVKHYPSSAFGGKSFAKFQSTVQKRFGSGRKKEAALYHTTDKSFAFLEFLDRESRMRAVDRTGDLGTYALVFEDMDTVRSLASLRPNAPKPKANKVAAKTEEEDDDDEGSMSSVASSRGATSKAAKGRSIFDESQDGESDDEYEARKKQVVTDKKTNEQRVYQRKEEMKKGKALDSLQGIEDDDPLSGMN